MLTESSMNTLLISLINSNVQSLELHYFDDSQLTYLISNGLKNNKSLKHLTLYIKTAKFFYSLLE